MNEFGSSTDVTGPIIQQQQTETSPLKKNGTKNNWISQLFFNSANDNEQGSLKSITLFFVIFSVLVTLGLLVQMYYGGYQTLPHGSIVSDSHECSEIGLNVLKSGGSGVDAAIATTMCLGVVNFYVTGLGGGGYMLVYHHKNHKVLDVIDFQTTVPNSLGNKPIDISVEGMTVGVPGLLMGMWEAHKKFGKLPWKDLIMPASDIARQGFLVNKNLVSASTRLNLQSRNNKNLVQLLRLLKEGENVTFPALADTLELIATTGTEAFYDGSIAMEIIDSVKKANGSMTLNDLAQYHTNSSDVLHSRFGDFDILSSGSSSGGAFLLNALDTIQFLDLNSDDDISSIVLKLSDVLHDTYIAFLEKNDANPVESDSVGSQVSVVDDEEIYVAVVSGLNTWLGSQLLTGAGFILNNAVANGGINSEGRPLSLSAPVIALENGEICGKRLILGSGDATIAAQVLTNALILKKNVSSSIESPRFFIDNVPRHIRVEEMHEPFYDLPTLNRLRLLLSIDRIPFPYKSVNVIEKNGDNVDAYSDSRGGGLPSQFK